MKTIKLLFCLSLFFFRFSFTYGQTWLWAKDGSGTGNGEGFSVAIDREDNAFLTGYILGSQKFGSDSVNCNPYPGNAFLVKYDKNGNALWAKAPTSSLHSNSKADVVATDSKGNSFISGFFTDTVNFGGYPLFTKNYVVGNVGDIFLAKYDPNGNVLWAKAGITPSITSYGELNENSIATDTAGNVYIAGEFVDSITFGTTTLSGRGCFVFLVKYDPNGNVVWAKQSTSSQYGNNGAGVATDKAGNIYVTGFFYSAITFGSHALNTFYQATFLVKYSSAGNVIWAKQSNIPWVTCYGYSLSVATDKAGYEYITGAFGDTLIFGIDTLKNSAPESSIFFVKYDSLGNVIWAKQFENIDSNHWLGYSVATDTLEHLYIYGGGGYRTCKLKYGNDTLSTFVPGNGSKDAASFIAQFDSSGKMLCSSMIACGGDDPAISGGSIATNPSGNCIYIGDDILYYPAVFGNDTLVPYGTEDPFVARWAPCYLETGVEKTTSQKAILSLFPNPNNGKFTIKSTVQNNKLIVEIYNMLGEITFTEPLRSIQGDNTIDLNSQPSGVYLYRVISENGNLIGEGKFVIQK
ncbi:MAG TPA: T9SS type A sorting domain-containing protein [Bacteroidia bacterium]|nr:T9SS type A sorting domain-containing protein [Bacteroidia bacterium]